MQIRIKIKKSVKGAFLFYGNGFICIIYILTDQN